MGAGVSSATQIANANITQQYSGTCKISCNNSINNASIQTINSHIDGDIRVTQTCAVNGQCVMNSTAGALADVAFKATNAVISAPWFGTEKSESYQDINENIQQYVNQKCEVSSSNEMNNISIFAANSYIGGGISIGQNATVGGDCSLSSLMSATAKATEIADNCSSAGKAAKKKACSGKGGGIGSILLYGIIAVVLFVAVMMVVKYMKGGALPDCTDELVAAKKPCKTIPNCTDELIASKTPCKTPQPAATPVLPRTESPNTRPPAFQSPMSPAFSASPYSPSPVVDQASIQQAVNSAVQQAMIQQAVTSAVQQQVSAATAAAQPLPASPIRSSGRRR